MREMTIARALQSPSFRLTLSAGYLRRMGRLETLVKEHGKSDGLIEWSLEEVRALMLEHDGALYVEGGRYDLRTATDRNKLAARTRGEGRWWLRQGISVSDPRIVKSEEIS